MQAKLNTILLLLEFSAIPIMASSLMWIIRG